MLLGKRFTKDIGSMLPSVEEAKDAEEEEQVQLCLGGIPSRPPSRPLARLSRGGVENKIVPRSAKSRLEHDSDEHQNAAESYELEASEEKAQNNVTENNVDEAEGKEENWDTELEVEEIKEQYDPTGKAKYLSACQFYGVIPVSYFLRHLQDPELVMRHHGLGPQATKALAVTLVTNTRIVTLDLSDNWLGGEGAAAIAEMLKENCYISGETLGTAIAENTGMLELNLSWNNFRGKGAAAIARGLGANIFLKAIDLSYNGFGNDGAAALGEALKVNNVLEDINISNNRISVQGAVRFAMCLKANKTLRILKISRNPMQSEGCFAILKAIQANSESAMECLDFSDILVNKEFDDLYNTMKAALPNLSVKHGGNPDMFKKQVPKLDPMKKVIQYIKEHNLQVDELSKVPEEDKSLPMTYEEFQKNLTGAGIVLPHNDLQQLIDFLDTNKSNMIDFSVFQKGLSS
ncbi:leucine-rich repeat-containing protein 74B isoform X2 [Xenopus tropicalis]|uniref:Leucine-rich repeat-containing protein 74B isoform X2 n=1 Tax=Xenopus tropicalis TaxID=8364 RepID=A0A8J0SQQ8_XENTR|nr:leucine-rich repeat-containing protein 74B isoform X2 [Xenopus tropicalis]|eukprot:XP_017945538.1 PREDICTED: leucine-rich repeat-containing protein 74B isoform X2 [Xenopus tropicalis]